MEVQCNQARHNFLVLDAFVREVFGTWYVFTQMCLSVPDFKNLPIVAQIILSISMVETSLRPTPIALVNGPAVRNVFYVPVDPGEVNCIE